MYSFDFRQAITQPEKFERIIDMWEREEFDAMVLYKKVKAYYDHLKQKYSRQNNDIDDDDF